MFDRHFLHDRIALIISQSWQTAQDPHPHNPHHITFFVTGILWAYKMHEGRIHVVDEIVY